MSYRELDRLLRCATPALYAVPGHGLVAVVAVQKRWGGRLSILGRDLRVHHRPAAWLRAALASALEATLCAEVGALLLHAELAGRDRARAERRLLDQRLATQSFEGCFLLRLPAGSPSARQAARLGLWRNAASLLVTHLLYYGCTLGAFVILGQTVLGGRVDKGWLAGCLLLLVASVPLYLFATAVEQRLATFGGVLLKQRLLAAVLRSPTEALREGGVGRFLGQILETETLEWFVASGGLTLALGLVDLLFGAALLGLTPSRSVELPLLLLFGGLSLLLYRSYHRRRQRWTLERLALSEQLIESMVGHRTRLVQEPATHLYLREDQCLGQYLESSRRLDDIARWLSPGLVRGWLLIGFIGLFPTWIAGQAQGAGLALSIWVLILTSGALGQLGNGLLQLSGAILAGRQLGPMFQSASPMASPPTVSQYWAGRQLAAKPPADPIERTPILSMQQVRHTPKGRVQPVLQDCNLEIASGDRVLLEGPSGGGKSTLAAVLAGLRMPDSGLILAEGLDLATLGLPAWRRRIVLAPQYHENHVFSASLAFNLLLGSAWPPPEADLRRAKEVCNSLGLGPLLNRMPAGLHQLLGETGWRLSHGERSRLFLARALLQRAKLVILDESLAALDPATLTAVARCLIQTREALVLIAHP
jgi:ATP-binding cassette subfamily B protein